MSKWNEGKVEIYDSLRDNESHFCLPAGLCSLNWPKKKKISAFIEFFLYNYQIPLVSFDFIALFSSPSQAAAQIQDDVSGTLPSQRLNFPRGTREPHARDSSRPSAALRSRLRKQQLLQIVLVALNITASGLGRADRAAFSQSLTRSRSGLIRPRHVVLGSGAKRIDTTPAATFSGFCG